MGYVITAVISFIAGGVVVYIYRDYIARKEQAAVNEIKTIYFKRGGGQSIGKKL